MTDGKKQTEHLRAELLAMRERIAELEKSEAGHRLAEKAHKEAVERHLRSAEELRVENEHFRQSLIDAIPTPIFYKDMKGRYLYGNKAFGTVMGRTTSEIIGLTVFDVQPEDIAQKYHEMDLRLFSEPGVQTYETSLVYADGATHDVIFNKATFLNKDGSPGGLIGVIFDITERKDTERELEAKSLNLEEVNTALKVLLQQRERDKDEVEDHILHNVKDLVFPYVERIKQRHMDQQQAAYLDILETNLKNIISPFMQKLTSIHGRFTPAEINVANFIREGKTVKEISKIIGVSESSINTHRQHIRNKLGLANQKTNLKTYLMSLIK
jgi:PAS domain S-box-containing protein